MDGSLELFLSSLLELSHSDHKGLHEVVHPVKVQDDLQGHPICFFSLFPFTRVYRKWSIQSRFKMTWSSLPVFFICIFCICFLFLITRVHMNLSTKSRFKTICRTMTAAKRKVQTFMPWYNLGSGSEKQARKHPVTVTRLTNQITWKIMNSIVDNKD